MRRLFYGFTGGSFSVARKRCSHLRKALGNFAHVFLRAEYIFER